MRKLICYGLFVSLISLSCTKTDVDNNQIASDKNNMSVDKFTMMVAKAKNFFETQITASASQKFKKTPIWERASYAKMKSGAEKIIVPLKYDKDYSFKTSFSGNKKLSLEKQSYLSIYKDVSGNYQADVVTTYPDESFLNDMRQPFQGLLTIDDWNENRIRTYLHKDGKLYNVEKPHFIPADNSSQTSGRISTICMTVYWFWCEGWESNLSQCSYIGYTTYENCADFMSLEPPGEEGEYVYEQDRGKNWVWYVTGNYGASWHVMSSDFVQGVHGGLNSCNGIFGPGGKLTSISHTSSYLSVTSSPDYSWTQVGTATNRNDNCSVYSAVTGKVTYTATGQFTEEGDSRTLSFIDWFYF